LNDQVRFLVTTALASFGWAVRSSFWWRCGRRERAWRENDRFEQRVIVSETGTPHGIDLRALTLTLPWWLSDDCACDGGDCADRPVVHPVWACSYFVAESSNGASQILVFVAVGRGSIDWTEPVARAIGWLHWGAVFAVFSMAVVSYRFSYSWRTREL